MSHRTTLLPWPAVARYRVSTSGAKAAAPYRIDPAAVPGGNGPSTMEHSAYHRARGAPGRDHPYRGPREAADDYCLNDRGR
jgi:hypothetical protein